MTLLSTYGDYISVHNKGEKAAFEAAMLERIDKEGYKMADLMYELFVCQKDLMLLKMHVSKLLSKPSKAKEKAKGK